MAVSRFPERISSLTLLRASSIIVARKERIWVNLTDYQAPQVEQIYIFCSIELVTSFILPIDAEDLEVVDFQMLYDIVVLLWLDFFSISA
jgi:hypothetical protein